MIGGKIMSVVLAVTSNIETKIQLIKCRSTEEAINIMKNTYRELCKIITYDINNTCLDENAKYAQIVNGFEQIEFRIGEI